MDFANVRVEHTKIVLVNASHVTKVAWIVLKIIGESYVTIVLILPELLI